MVEIGERLTEIKAQLGRGKFGEWLKAEFDWTDRTARLLMQVANAFKSETVSDLPIGTKALYTLSAPSVPQAARDEAIALATTGHTVTHAEAQEIKARHQPDIPDKPTRNRTKPE